MKKNRFMHHIHLQEPNKQKVDDSYPQLYIYVKTHLPVCGALSGSVCPSHWHRWPWVNGHYRLDNCFEAGLWGTQKAEKTVSMNVVKSQKACVQNQNTILDPNWGWRREKDAKESEKVWGRK